MSGIPPAPLPPRARRAPPSVRCEHCGYELAGLLTGIAPKVRCPECGKKLNALWGSRLEAWPGTAPALKECLLFLWPGLGLFLLIASYGLATEGRKSSFLFFAAGLGTLLAVGDAIYRARKRVWASIAKVERREYFLRLGGAAGGIMLAVWTFIWMIVLALRFL